MIKAVIFDLDGTLFYSLPDIYQAVQFALIKHQCTTVTIDEVKGALGSGVHHLIDTITGSCPLETKKEVLKTYESYYLANATQYSTPYDGIIELLDILKKRNINIGVASNKSNALVKRIINTYFKPYVNAYRGEIIGKPKKPDPDMIIEVMHQLSVSKDEVIYVGDSEQDVVAAKKLECLHIAVCYGYRDVNTLKRYYPDNIVESVEALNQVLERIMYGSD